MSVSFPPRCLVFEKSCCDLLSNICKKSGKKLALIGRNVSWRESAHDDNEESEGY